MDKGQAAEFDSPQDLLADKKSQFFAMAQSAKLVWLSVMLFKFMTI